MKNAVIYARYSSHKQREESIEYQLEICHKFAEENGYNIIKEYCDREQSGRSDKRSKFQELIEESKKRNFEAVIVWRFDRFSRKRTDSQDYKNILKANNVDVISATEPIPEGASGIMVEGIFELLAQYFSEELKEKVINGMVKNAEKGMFNGSYRPYGYDIDHKILKINMFEAPVVRKIFDMYANGETVKAIIDYCTERGYTSPQGKDFDYSFIYRLLKNKKYIGVFAWGNIERIDVINSIVDEQIFNKVQTRLQEESNTGARAKAKIPYVLVGKVFCGECEQPMVADSVTKVKKKGGSTPVSTFTTMTVNNIHSAILNSTYEEEEETEKITYRYYKCRGRKQKAYLNGCKKENVDKDTLENAVISYTARQYFSEDNFNTLAKAIYKIQKTKANNPNIKKLKEKIKEERGELDNLLKMVREGYGTKSVYIQIKQSETLIEDYEKELEELSIDTTGLTLDDIKKRLNKIKQKMLEYVEADKIPIEVKKAFCDAFVSRVYVFDDDNGGGGGKKGTRVKIVFDAFETDGLGGFNDVEFNLSSISTSLGSPKQNDTLVGVVLFYLS